MEELNLIYHPPSRGTACPGHAEDVIDISTTFTHNDSMTAFRALVLILLLVIILVLFDLKTPVSKNTPTPTPFNPFPYQRPTIQNKSSYITFLVGDSMVNVLGKNANQLRLYLIERYPGHEFVNYNYGFGATTVLSLPERVNEQTEYGGEKFPPIIKEQFDLIIIESFAYNPLSNLPLEEGLQKQTETLEGTVKQLIKEHPNSVVAIMATIAPSQDYFAKGVYDLKPEERKKWAEERIKYIENAIKFAGERNLPLINVYEKSLKKDGKVDLKYINPTNYIHPSDMGIKLISKTIADFIFENKIFPE